ncbi:MAG: hypothetical protein GY755_16240 [Chloroflexi bacterium]|nr:hypothetical protein [Chloroflexota bacterium]
MKIKTAWSINKNTNKAIDQAYQQLENELGAQPSLIIAYTSVIHESNLVLESLKKNAPHSLLHGGTSCQGAMTEEGFHSKDGIGLGLLGIHDPEGSYGIGLSNIEGDGRAAGARAIQEAIQNAGRAGEPPDLVWLNSAPGLEEDILLGIQDIIGENVPVAGGSTADNTVSGEWYQFTHQDISQDAVVVSAMYPSVKTHLAFHSGYSPTQHRGEVTKAEHRTLYEIDGRPAAQVYNEWTEGVVQDALEGGNVLLSTTLTPLGRMVGAVGEMPYYQLSHPESVTPEGGLSLFSEIEVGQEIFLMKGTQESLVSRAGRTARSALRTERISSRQISGALVVYCAGCMLTVQEQMPEVAEEIRTALGGNPFLGIFTFGEQGCFIRGENRHGNLMISVVVFESS